jgi:type II protein arginine methyltransferase
VSIWRLTNQRQVWYEWYAESFLWARPAIADKDQPSPLPPASASLLRSPSSPYNPMPSPLLDAIDMFTFPDKRERQTPVPEDTFATDGLRMVKIGQTSLHNPSGQSSWIGL